MALITVPTNFSFTTVTKFGLDRATNVLRSHYTGQMQRVSYPYAVWVFEGTLVPYDTGNAAAIRSFFSKLEGQKNSFRLPVPGYVVPQSGYNINLNTTASAVARATSVIVGGGVANGLYLVEGDYITINDELKIVTANSPFSNTGTATIAFIPPLRKVVAIGTSVISVNPSMLMTAADDKVANWGITAPYRHALKLNAVEDISNTIYSPPVFVAPVYTPVRKTIDGGFANNSYTTSFYNTGGAS